MMRLRLKFAVLVVIVFAIGAMLGASVASVSHVDSSPGGCNLCFVAHTVAYETPAAHLIFGPEMVGRTTAPAPEPAYQARAVPTSLSRGPPSFV